MVPPAPRQDIYALVPGTCEYYYPIWKKKLKKDFVNMIKYCDMGS